MSVEHNKCPTCGHNVDKREILLYRGLVGALSRVYGFSISQGKHEFAMKEIRHLLGRNEYARFGDWVMFGGLVYKKEKASYGLNVERCKEFFQGKLAVPTKIWKDPVTGELEKLESKLIYEIPKLFAMLDSTGLYWPEYKPR